MNMIRSLQILTFADLLDSIERDEGLNVQRRRNLCSSIRTFIKATGRSTLLSASFPEFRNCLRRLEDGSHGLSRSRWSNVKSDTRFALERYGAPARAPLRKDLSADWLRVRLSLDGRRRLRLGLSRFIHWASLYGIGPDEVTDEVMASFKDHLIHHSTKLNPAHAHQQTCKLWNDAGDLLDDWPGQKVLVPTFLKRVSLPRESFPTAFWDDVERYLTFMGGRDLFNPVSVAVPRKPNTLEGHRGKIWRLASALVGSGIPIEQVVGLKVLVEPANCEAALRHYHALLGGLRPSLFETAAVMVVIAKDYVRVVPPALARLKELRNHLKCRKPGMTDKNRGRLRSFLDPKTQYRFLSLADVLIEEADKRGNTYKGALRIQTALIHEILLAAPLRFANLIGLHLDRHVRWIGEKKTARIILSIPADEVKNGEMLEYELPERTGHLFKRYLERYRPLLLKGTDEGWLLPAATTGHKHEVTLRWQLCRAVEKRIGFKINPHLYRHIAAFFYLQGHPGDYEVVRRLLGHKSVDTTMTFYAEFDGLAARKLYNDLILRKRDGLIKKIGGKV